MLEVLIFLLTEVFVVLWKLFDDVCSELSQIARRHELIRMWQSRRVAESRVLEADPPPLLRHDAGKFLFGTGHTFRNRNARIITYCGGGIVASTEAFVLTRLGFDNVAVYMASLEEWTAQPTNPMETA